MREITLTRGKVALIDDADFERVSQFKWCAVIREHVTYAIRFTSRANGKRKVVQLHRFVLGIKAQQVKVDHKDHDGLNCQRSNLRACESIQNSRNMKKPVSGRTSKFKGVDFPARDKKWRAGIRMNYKTIFLGYHKTEEDAARAYDAAAIKYFGEFAHLNFPAKPQGTVTLTQTEAQARA